MSLTSFIEIPEIKTGLHQNFLMPKLTEKRDIIAPLISSNPSHTGIAFDYLLRFYIQKINPSSLSQEWIAENLLAIIRNSRIKNNWEKSKTEEGAEKAIKNARGLHSKYIESKKDRAGIGLIKASIQLAYLDEMYRGGVWYGDGPPNTFDKKEIIDLINLLKIVNPVTFKTTNICLLNPRFGKTAEIIRGADADLVIDDTLIDIKTTKNFSLHRREFNQLLGYYLLHRIDGAGQIKPKIKIKKLGIYYSRFGYLYTVNLEDIGSEKTFTNFAKFFKNKAVEIDQISKEMKERREKDGTTVK